MVSGILIMSEMQGLQHIPRTCMLVKLFKIPYSASVIYEINIHFPLQVSEVPNYIEILVKIKQSYSCCDLMLTYKLRIFDKNNYHFAR